MWESDDMEKQRYKPAFEVKNGAVTVVMNGPSKQTQSADWFRSYVEIFRWVKSSTKQSGWDKEYRLRMRDVPDLRKCWKDFASFFEKWAEDSALRWTPEFVQSPPTIHWIAPGCKRIFSKTKQCVLVQVIETNAHLDARDMYHTYLEMTRLEQSQDVGNGWQFENKFLAVNVEALTHCLGEFDTWFGDWEKPCEETKNLWQGNRGAVPRRAVAGRR